jgi:hypothetical protein
MPRSSLGESSADLRRVLAEKAFCAAGKVPAPVEWFCLF